MRNPTAEELKKARLPENFGPNHAEWNTPSKRNKYNLLLEAASKTLVATVPQTGPVTPIIYRDMDLIRLMAPSKRNKEFENCHFHGSLAVMTICSGAYQWFAPLFKYQLAKQFPEVTPLIYAHGDIVLAGSHKKILKKDDVLAKFKAEDYTTAALRFLFSDDEIESYDYVLITDIDMMMRAEQIPIVKQHMQSLLVWDTKCYDNYNQYSEEEPILPGVHFVTKAWWEKTRDERKRQSDILLKSVPDKGYDELMLGQLVKNSGLPLPSNEQHLWAHHGIHLGSYRGKAAKGRGVDAYQQTALRDMMNDKEFMALVEECGSHFPLISEIFKNLTTMMIG